MATVQSLLRSVETTASADSRRDAEILLGHCLDKTRAWLYTWPEAEVADSSSRRFAQLLARRSEGVPIAYLTGRREFWSLQLAVNEHTLIPRPETETLVEWALELAPPGDAAVLDLGTGCGAIALAVASERPRWQVVGVDASTDALLVARSNAAQAGLQRVSFLHSDWYQAVAGRRFHLLLANPPYIDPQDPHLTRGDVRFEPRSALVSSQGGLADLVRLVSDAPAYLWSGAWLLLEHGFAQGPAVRNLLGEAGFSEVATRRDMAGHERITGGCWHAE